MRIKRQSDLMVASYMKSLNFMAKILCITISEHRES